MGYWRFVAGWENNDLVRAGDVDRTWFFDGGIYNFTQWKIDREQELINEINANVNFYEEQWHGWLGSSWTN